ncbi:hypothetical protein M5689_022122 [Euphorbia peplus]|nr:hypothetical protein M5689_022122 [Euphorbia peplus]
MFRPPNTPPPAKDAIFECILFYTKCYKADPNMERLPYLSRNASLVFGEVVDTSTLGFDRGHLNLNVTQAESVGSTVGTVTEDEDVCSTVGTGGSHVSTVGTRCVHTPL